MCRFVRFLRRRLVLLIVGLTFLSAGFSICLHFAFNLPVALLPGQVARTTASFVLQYVYYDDSETVAEITDSYYQHFNPQIRNQSCQSSVDLKAQGFYESRLVEPIIHSKLPFVYVSPQQHTLKKLHDIVIADTAIDQINDDEFTRMLALFRWIGTRWDHGIDIPKGGYTKFDPVELLQEVKQGKRFWCEVAARFTVYAASAMGWPARLVSLSRNGYEWEHAVAEVWSNQYEKWFIVDADYNLMYFYNGKPLSAFELCHYGPTIFAEGRLVVLPIAPPKISVKSQNLLPYYSYVHIDLRNDWLSRDLAKGSPAGGDLSTWWTARSALGSLFTVKIRNEDQSTFDWPVNVVNIKPCRIINGPVNKRTIVFGFDSYGPYFSHYLWQIDGSGWHPLHENHLSLDLDAGYHDLEVKFATKGQSVGPLSKLTFRIDQ